MTMAYLGRLKKILYMHLKLSILIYLLITTQRQANDKDNFDMTEKYFSSVKSS